MAEYITVELHNEFAKRLEEENTRQNHRLANLEEAVSANNKIAISVEKMAISIEGMQKDINRQGEKLEEICSRDGKKWQKVTEYVALAIIGAGLGFLLAQIGF
jgi:hypothetical protein